MSANETNQQPDPWAGQMVPAQSFAAAVSSLGAAPGSLPFSPVDDALELADSGDRTPNDPLAVLAEEVRSVRKKWRSDQRLLAGAFLLLKEAGVMPDSTKLIDAAERAEAAMREANTQAQTRP